jgi:aspartyl-tRNA(Asn)/glutamyl-tRNA(Gln) amidotransferase subunit A
MSALHQLTTTQLAAKIAAKEISSVEATQAAIARAKQHESLGAFLCTNEEVALRQARAADARIAAGERTALLGVPIAHKDIFVTGEFPSTAASKMLASYTSPFDATVVQNLAREGVVSIGKLNCDEFAMGGSNENSAYGAVRNPWDSTRIPGGSSGGTAVAVAARIVSAATGTDTGGSVRQPASLCGITGIKPTYGRCSRYGMIAFASSLDQAGVMAQTAQDCATLLHAMSGFDERDATSADRDKKELLAGVESARAAINSIAKPLQGLRIGLPKEYFSEGVEASVQSAVHASLAALEKLGASLIDISLPRTALSVPVYYIVAPAEASSNLSRFDGVRYGHRASDYKDLLEMYKKSRAEGFGTEVKRRIMIGTYVLSHGYYDAYYLQAQKIRRLIAQDFQTAFKQCDLIAGPVSPTVAWKIGGKTDPVANYLADVFTLGASLAGLPGISLPAGFGEGNMPVGLQLIGNYWRENTLLQTGMAFQAATDWHTRMPQGV